MLSASCQRRNLPSRLLQWGFDATKLSCDTHRCPVAFDSWRTSAAVQKNLGLQEMWWRGGGSKTTLQASCLLTIVVWG